MYATEQDLASLAQTLRSEFAQIAQGVEDELSVRITEAHNRTAGITIEDVRALLTELGIPGEHLSADDVRALIPNSVPFDDEYLKGRILALHTFADELADRIGAPRMEG